MKYILATIFIYLATYNSGWSQTFDPQKYIIEKESNISKEEPGPHKGGGNSVSHVFFKDAKDYKTSFRKRVLKPTAAIGYHQQKEDEVYYIVSGKGEMKLNEETYEVTSGDAILTRTGSSHGIKNTSKEDLVIIIVYDHHIKAK